MNPCSIEGCDRPARAKQFCNTHYYRWRRCGDPMPDVPIGEVPPRNKQDTCTIDDCKKPATAKQMCSMHYNRWRRHGDPRNGGFFKIPPLDGECFTCIDIGWLTDFSEPVEHIAQRCGFTRGKNPVEAMRRHLRAHNRTDILDKLSGRYTDG